MMDDDAQLDVDNLHALQDMYEGYYAALDEYDRKSKFMPAHDAEHAYDRIQQMKLDIESFEMMSPRVAAAYHGD